MSSSNSLQLLPAEYSECEEQVRTIVTKEFDLNEQIDESRIRVCHECNEKISQRLSELVKKVDSKARSRRENDSDRVDISDDEYYDYDEDDAKSTRGEDETANEATEKYSDQADDDDSSVLKQREQTTTTRSVSPNKTVSINGETSDTCSQIDERGENSQQNVGVDSVLLKSDKNNNFVLGDEFVEKIMQHSSEETKNFFSSLIGGAKNRNTPSGEYATVTHKQISDVSLIFIVLNTIRRCIYRIFQGILEMIISLK